MLVQSGGGYYVLPLGNVVELLMLGTGQNEVSRQTLGGQSVINLRGADDPAGKPVGAAARQARCDPP